MAVTAMILGITGLCFPPLGLIALILGIIVLASNKPSAKNSKGFAIAGVAVGGISLIITPLLIAILLPALGAARRTARRMQNSTQIRAVHQGMVMYSNSNLNNFPGLTASGDILADGIDTGNSGHGNTPQARFWILMNGQFFTPDYAVSPSETAAITPWSGTGYVTQDNYSYAMLSFGKSGVPTGTPAAYTTDPATADRASEWSQTLNSQAVVISDRNIGSNTSTNIQSIHTDPGSWKGSVLWNDNYVGFEMSHLMSATKYGGGSMNSQDHLFEDAGPSDALMVWDKP